MRSISVKLVLLVILIIGASCGNDIPDCPSQLCTLVGGWQLVEVRVNGITDPSFEMSNYRLMLHMPNPTTALTSDFDRTNPGGRQDTGTWELRNNNSILALHPQGSPQENYIIDHITPRQMILIIDLDQNKTGRDEYKLILEPF